MSYTFRDPDPPAQFKPADNNGEVVLIVHGGYHPAVATKEYGIKPASRATVVVVTGRMAGTIVEDHVFFGARQSSQFKDAAGGDVVLCRIVKDGKAINYEPGSSYDRRVANEWIDANRAKLDELRADAVRNFREQCDRVDEGLREAHHNAPRPAPSPQFTPPAQDSAPSDPPKPRNGDGIPRPMDEDQELPLDDEAPF